jgi:hypothetical protein
MNDDESTDDELSDDELSDDEWTDIDSSDDELTGDDRTEIELGEVIHRDIEEIDIDVINDSINDSLVPIDIYYNSIEEFCPVINSRNMEYEINNIQPNGDIKCKNYELCCDTVFAAPFKNNYLCDDCDNTYEKQLEIKENVECPICLDIKRGVLQPRCSHFTCVDCFKLCYYFYEIIEPKFPYPDLEDEYDDDIHNPKWINDYPLIRPYWKELRNYNSKIKEKKKKTFLKKCPLCRK